jgi:hypothetical protein
VDEGTAVAPADRQIAGASKHRSRDNRCIGERVRDRTGRGQVSAVCDRGVTGRRQWHTELFEEDDDEQATRLVMQHEQPYGVSEWPPPTRFLQPAWNVADE